MELVGMLFQTSVTVIALYFTILSILVALKQKGEFIPRITTHYATASCVLLYIVSLISLITLIVEEYVSVVPYELEESVVLAALFILGMLFMIFSLKEMLRRI